MLKATVNKLAIRFQFKLVECGNEHHTYRNTVTKEDAVNMLEGKSTLQRDLCGLEERPAPASGSPARPSVPAAGTHSDPAWGQSKMLG